MDISILFILPILFYYCAYPKFYSLMSPNLYPREQTFHHKRPKNMFTHK